MCPRGFGSSASAGRAMAAEPAGLFIRRPPRSVRSPRASPVLVFSPMSWSASTAITSRFIGRAKSSPGTGSISIARLSRTGWAALVGGWSRCRPPFDRRVGKSWPLGDPTGQRINLLSQLVGRHHAIDQAERQCGFGIHWLAQDEKFKRATRTQQLGEQPSRAAVRIGPEHRVGGDEVRAGSRDGEIRPGCQADPNARRRRHARQR